jgi:succinyl-CoA synthetase beta subunit
MRIHEYQAKDILREYGIPIPKGRVAGTPAEAREIALEIGSDEVVIKAQIHAGGRCKGGGIKLASTPWEAQYVAGKIIGMQLITAQTGPEGEKVRRVLVEEAQKVKREIYLAIINRAQKREQPVFVASNAGGVEIEEILLKSPEKIIRVYANPDGSFSGFEGRKIAYGLGLGKPLVSEASGIIRNLHRLFIENDASYVEINPLAVTEGGELLALDAKISFDDDALFRHPEIRELRDLNEEDPLEAEARDIGVSYIRLDGNVACIANGAGLAMTTMDLIKLWGGKPANFLDIGGRTSAEQIGKAFGILNSDDKVKSVFVNIFGGILRCDRVAGGIVEAALNTDFKHPMVIRLKGTNGEEGKRILKESPLKFELAEGLNEAAQRAVHLARSQS